MKTPVAVSAALLVLAQAAAGQVVVGNVVGAATGRPVAGALLILVDSARAEWARTASASAGAFTLPAPRGGEYRIVVLRIGFARWESTPLQVGAGDTVRYAIELPEEPLRLTEIKVERESGCRVRPGAGEVVGTLWEEARKALALADMTKRERKYLFRTIRTEQRVSTALRPLENARVTGVGLAHWSFRSASADSLARLGFVLPDSTGARVYHGPDVDVLFSDVFLEQHCFRLHVDREAGLIGLAFEPLRRRAQPDIAGVLWLDQQTAALRRLEFAYTNLEPWVPRGPAGGSIHFDILPTGAWVISRWLLRAPVPQVVASGAARETGLGGYVEFVGAVGEVLGADGRVIRSYPPAP
jgi:hypothetical protein